MIHAKHAILEQGEIAQAAWMVLCSTQIIVAISFAMVATISSTNQIARYAIVIALHATDQMKIIVHRAKVLKKF